MSIYYVEPITVPDNNAHSLQIETNSEELYKLEKNYFLVSYRSKNDKKKLGFNHIFFTRPKIYNRVIPLSTFHLIFKINKEIQFDKKKDVVITRSAYIANKLRKKVKKVIYEMHRVPEVSFKINILDMFYHLILREIPFHFIKNKENICFGVISYGIKDELIKKKVDPKKIFLIPDGTDIDKFDINYSKEKARVKLGIKSKKKIVMYIGSFLTWKGHLTLLEASKNLGKDVEVYLIGGKQEEVNKLQRKFPNCKFLGRVKHDLIPYYLKASDVLVIPNNSKPKISSHYTSPLKLFEYMAAKRPIVASDLPSIKEIVSKEEVIFFEPENVVDITKKIKFLLSNSRIQKNLVNNSFKKVKNYTWKNRVKKIIEISK